MYTFDNFISTIYTINEIAKYDSSSAELRKVDYQRVNVTHRFQKSHAIAEPIQYSPFQCFINNLNWRCQFLLIDEIFDFGIVLFFSDV